MRQANVYLQYHSFVLEISKSFTLVFEMHSTLCHLPPGRWQNGFYLQLSTHHSTPLCPSLLWTLSALHNYHFALNVPEITIFTYQE